MAWDVCLLNPSPSSLQFAENSLDNWKILAVPTLQRPKPSGSTFIVAYFRRRSFINPALCWYFKDLRSWHLSTVSTSRSIPAYCSSLWWVKTQLYVFVPRPGASFSLLSQYVFVTAHLWPPTQLAIVYGVTIVCTDNCRCYYSSAGTTLQLSTSSVCVPGMVLNRVNALATRTYQLLSNRTIKSPTPCWSFYSRTRLPAAAHPLHLLQFYGLNDSALMH